MLLNANAALNRRQPVHDQRRIRNLIGLAAAAATAYAITEFQAAQCEARWRGGNLIASYSLLTGCMVEVGYLRVPEGAIRVPQNSIRLRVNPNVIE